MRLQITKSANAECFYIVKSFRKNGRNTSQVVERLGNLEEVKKKAGDMDPYEWGKQYAEELSKKDHENSREILIPFSQSKLIDKDSQQKFNGGYLFLQKIYSELKIKDICKAIDRRRKFEFDLNSILSRLIYCRVIQPCSKLGTYEYSKQLLEAPKFELHQIYRALDILAKESDYIQERLYINSKNVISRNTDVLYYDCTNYFFEIEEEKGSRKYGACKEHRPNPIVQMGLMMDGNGIPLSFCINDGNKNEQTTLKPLEEQIISDFKLSNFIICTDAGLSSANNKFFNSYGKRDYITATSVKKLPEERSSKFLAPGNWKLVGDKTGATYNINEIDTSDELREKYYESTFYKEEWFLDTVDVFDEMAGKTVKRDLSQRLIVTFSFKYRDYLKAIRNRRIQRAEKLIEVGEKAISRKGYNDVREFISEVAYTDDGTVADRKAYGINREAIAEAEKYDGFYAVYTSLDDKKYPVSRVNEINHGRWEIEESFRIMKSEFHARPVYLQRDERIKAHFLTCYIALLILRILENRLDYAYTYEDIIACLADMEFTKAKDFGVIPAYTRTNLTDALHEKFGFRTDYEILSPSTLKKIYSTSKNPEIL